MKLNQLLMATEQFEEDDCLYQVVLKNVILLSSYELLVIYYSPSIFPCFYSDFDSFVGICFNVQTYYITMEL